MRAHRRLKYHGGSSTAVDRSEPLEKCAIDGPRCVPPTAKTPGVREHVNNFVNTMGLRWLGVQFEGTGTAGKRRKSETGGGGCGWRFPTMLRRVVLSGGDPRRLVPRAHCAETWSPTHLFFLLWLLSPGQVPPPPCDPESEWAHVHIGKPRQSRESGVAGRRGGRFVLWALCMTRERSAPPASRFPPPPVWRDNLVPLLTCKKDFACVSSVDGRRRVKMSKVKVKRKKGGGQTKSCSGWRRRRLLEDRQETRGFNRASLVDFLPRRAAGSRWRAWQLFVSNKIEAS